MELFPRSLNDPGWNAYELTIYSVCISGYKPHCYPLPEFMPPARFNPAFMDDAPDTLTLPTIGFYLDDTCLLPCLSEILTVQMPYLLEAFARQKQIYSAMARIHSREKAEALKVTVQARRRDLAKTMLHLLDFGRLLLALYLTRCVDPVPRLMPNSQSLCYSIKYYSAPKALTMASLYFNWINLRKNLRKFAHDQTGLVPLEEFRTPSLDIWMGLPLWAPLQREDLRVVFSPTNSIEGVFAWVQSLNIAVGIVNIGGI